MNKIPRIAAVHDICGYGKCSLGTVLPVLSCAGFEVCPIPTGVYSKHTAFKNPTILDTSFMLDDFIASWLEENINIDAIYTGFLSSSSQAYSIMQLFANYPKAIRIVDPAFGDNGKLYSTCTMELLNNMKKLVSKADIIVPNITEACFLLDTDYSMPSIDKAKKIAAKLQMLGAKNVILTGVLNNDKICNIALSNSGKTFLSQKKCLPYQLHGAGDLFASVLVSKYLTNDNLFDATAEAADFVYEATKLSASQPGFKERGISFEPLLGKL